jgi:hypothetical protein
VSLPIKYILTFSLGIAFCALHYMKQRRQHSFQQATVLIGTVLESHCLDKNHFTSGFDLDRGNTLGSYIKIGYQIHGQTRVFETELVDRPYDIGETVHLEYIDNQQLRLQQPENNPYLIEHALLLIGGLLLVLSILGCILQR